MLNRRSEMAGMLACVCIALLCVMLPAQAATTQVHIVRYADDGTTILNETTVNYTWMMNNLPVLGDGVTHYYHQGPVFVNDPDPEEEELLRWSPKEDTNVLEKDMGAVKGTNLKDLCDLVGMPPEDEVMIHAPDGYHVEFGYANVYEPQPRQGPIVLCWYCGEDIPGMGERQGVGYPPDYFMGMRLVLFADTSTNPEGLHVFGNWDMHECLPEKWQHFFDELYPSTSGLSVKWVDEVRIYRGGYQGEVGSPVHETAPPTLPARAVPGFGLAGALIALLVLYMTRRRA